MVLTGIGELKIISRYPVKIMKYWPMILLVPSGRRPYIER
jgi:hypothetical protein